MESYLLHDANASSNFKIMMMIQKEGMKGYGIYWMILEFLRVQNGYKADVRILPVLARKMRVTVATLKRIIFDSGLFEVNDTTFSSPGLTRRMGPLEAKREANRESGRRGGLANQQRIREGMASDALPINQTNDINNSPSISPQRETGKNEEVLFEEKAVIGDKEYFVGYTKEYVKVAKETDENLENQIVSGRISGMLTDEILLFE